MNGTWTLPIPTEAGDFIAHFSSEGLKQLEFPGASVPGASAQDQTPAPKRILQWAERTKQALESVLGGHAPGALPPMDWSGSSDFQQSVWAALLRIPYGRTCTYGDIALDIDSPKATRAVGAACGANPIPVLVPCHRVLASGGAIGGFSGGLNWKRRLLKAEQAGAPFELRS